MLFKKNVSWFFLISVILFWQLIFTSCDQIFTTTTTIYNLTEFYVSDINQSGNLIEYEIAFNDGYNDYMPEGELTINLHWNGIDVDKETTITVNITKDMYSGSFYKYVSNSVIVSDSYRGACWLDYIYSFKQKNDTKIIRKSGKKINLGS